MQEPGPCLACTFLCCAASLATGWTMPPIAPDCSTLVAGPDLTQSSLPWPVSCSLKSGFRFLWTRPRQPGPGPARPGSQHLNLVDVAAPAAETVPPRPCSGLQNDTPTPRSPVIPRTERGRLRLLSLKRASPPKASWADFAWIRVETAPRRSPGIALFDLWRLGYWRLWTLGGVRRRQGCPGDTTRLRCKSLAIDLREWFGGTRSLSATEQVMGLGDYGKTVTVLTAIDIEDQIEEFEETW